MISRKDFYFLRKMGDYRSKIECNWYNGGIINDFAHKESASSFFYYSRNEEAYFRNRKCEDPRVKFAVSRSAFCHYEDYTPYHFAGFATKLFASKPERWDDLSRFSWRYSYNKYYDYNKYVKTEDEKIKDIRDNGDDVSYMSSSWKLGKTVNGQLDPAFAPYVALAVHTINSGFMRLERNICISDLFVVDPIGWTVPVKLMRNRRENENNFKTIGRNDANGSYIFEGLIPKPTEKRTCPLPIETHSYIVLYIDEINAQIQKVNNVAGGNPIKKENIIAYTLAHELFHAWQDFHVGLLHFDNWITGNPNPMLDDETETLAEFFALRFVRDVLKDKLLADILCKFWDDEIQKRQAYNMNPSPYALAVSKYGDVFEKSSLGKFLEDLSDWEDCVIRCCY